MHFAHRELDPELERTASVIVDAIGEVRRELGAGLVERVYVDCLVNELRRRGVAVEREVGVALSYKGEPLGRTLKLDLLVADQIVVEAKATEALHDVHFAQLLTYLRLTQKPLGFLVNFNAVPLHHGIHRRVNTRRM